VKRIGGKGAEALLAETLDTTGRGIDLVWLARALQEMAPNQYRESALVSARELLTRPTPASTISLVERVDRDSLFDVLTLFGDTSFVSAAQEQVVRANGQVDRSALKYLQQSLGAPSVPLVAQWYDDPRIRDPPEREPLARVALNYVGADAQANEFYEKAINDPTLTASHRRNLIEDLNEDGFPDKRNITARDLPLIDNRIDIIDGLLPKASDPVNIAAFAEAKKDLTNMRVQASQPAVPAPEPDPRSEFEQADVAEADLPRLFAAANSMHLQRDKLGVDAVILKIRGAAPSLVARSADRQKTRLDTPVVRAVGGGGREDRRGPARRAGCWEWRFCQPGPLSRLRTSVATNSINRRWAFRIRQAIPGQMG
jgi:hypothetical protein